jgi:hypothetical protein
MTNVGNFSKSARLNCPIVIFKLNQVLKAQPDSGMNASIMVFNSLSSAALRAPVL